MRTSRLAKLALTLSLVPVAAIVVAAPASAARSCHGQAATIVGTKGDDDLRGTPRDDVIVGLGGDDVLRGQGGNDVLCGSSGADRLLGGGGLDGLDGGDDDDEVNGGGGGDAVFGDDGTDALDGGGGIDELSFARSPNGVTVDLFAGTAEGLGTDTITGFEMVTGSDDDDAVTGGRSNETLIGGDGDDDLNGGPGDDLLDGGDGNDQIEGGPGAQNAVTYAHAPGGVEVNLPAGTATGWGTDTLAAVQVVIGSGFDDTIIGSGQRNTFIPGEGNDSVSGGGGPDTIDFSGGPDRDGRRPGGGNRRWAEDGHDHRGGGGHRIRARRHPDRERPAEHLDRRRGRRLPCSGTRARTRSTAGTIPTVWTAAPAPTPA